MNAVWVVEMMGLTGWQPTVGVALSRADVRKVLIDWQQRNPHDKFRIRKYTPEK